MKKYVYASNPDEKMKWRFIPDTPDERSKAIADGCTAFTIYSLEFEPTEGEVKLHGRKPKRYGDLWLDLDCEDNPAAAILQARELITYLMTHFKGFNPKMVRYFLSGAKGCHICIPAEMFGGEEGAWDLPLLHKEFLSNILALMYHNRPSNRFEKWGYIDTQLYKMGKGHLLREKNIKRKDNRYKIQVPAEYFLEMEPALLLSLTDKPQSGEVETTSPEICDLAKIYRRTLITRKLTFPSNVRDKAISNCDFVKFCAFCQDQVTEPQWFMMLRTLKACKATEEEMHELSMDHPEYDELDTAKKIEHSSIYGLPPCREIASVFDCSENCLAKGWKDVKARIDKTGPANFYCEEDGLYRETSSGKVRIGSPVRILGRIKDPSGRGWGRLLEITSNDNAKQLCIVSTSDYIGKGEAVIAQLCHLGFEPASRYVAKFVLDYIAGTDCTETYTFVSKIGWHDGCYILPDKIFGETEATKVYFNGKAPELTACGSVADWQENIGKYCQGNSLLMFCSAYALTGVLLEPCNMEGGGLHLYGASSKGKTTLANTGASILGNPNEGYVNQWKMTANALEIIAVMRNDSVLILDELGQANPEDVAKVAYMLPNGQGGGRMSRDATLKHIYRWKTNFFSNGELSISQKIESTGKNRTYAGQDVRVINLPINNDEGANIISCLHGFENPAALMDHLKTASRQFYGAPLRAFLEALFSGEGLKENVQSVIKYMEDFEARLLPPNASTQVQRVCAKFAHLAATGNFACKHGIFPWTTEEMETACKEWFEKWLKERGSVGDLEIENAIARILKFIEGNGDSAFIDRNSRYGLSHGQVGYSATTDRESQYFFIPDKLMKIAEYTNRKALVQELQKRDMLILNSMNKPLETISVNTDGVSRNKRVIGISIRDINEYTKENAERFDPSTCDTDIVTNALF